MEYSSRLESTVKKKIGKDGKEHTGVADDGRGAGGTKTSEGPPTSSTSIGD